MAATRAGHICKVGPCRYIRPSGGPGLVYREFHDTHAVVGASSGLGLKLHLDGEVLRVQGSVTGSNALARGGIVQGPLLGLLGGVGRIAILLEHPQGHFQR